MAKVFKLSEDELAILAQQIIDDTYAMMKDRIAASHAMHRALTVMSCAANWAAHQAAMTEVMAALEQARRAGWEPTDADMVCFTMSADETSYPN